MRAHSSASRLPAQPLFHSSRARLGISAAVFLALVGSGCGHREEQATNNLAKEIISSSLHTPSAERADALLRATLYDIKLEIAPKLDSFAVKEQVTYTNTTGQKLNELVFQLPGNASYLREVGEGDHFSISAVSAGGSPLQWTLDRSVLKVPLAKALEPGASIGIALEYRGTVPVLPSPPDLGAASIDQLMQLLTGRSSTIKNYGTYSLSDGILSLDHWYAVIPRFEGNAFDTEEPSGTGDVANFDIGNFNVEITHPKELIIACSGPVVRSKTTGEMTVSTVQGAGVRDMTVVGSTNFKTMTKTAGKTVVTSYYLPRDEKQSARLADFAVNSLNTFNELFGAYPYKTLNVVEAPLRGGAGGMEYTGLVTIGEQFLSIDKLLEHPMLQMLLAKTGGSAKASEMFADSVEFLVAHEVAHQWWHGLVGQNSKAHPFTDEALTNYSAVVAFEKLHGVKSAKQQEESQLELTYKVYRLTGGKDITVDRAASVFKDGMQYGAIIYSKGALLYRDLRKAMGDEQFFGFLKQYAKDNRFGFSDPQTIRKALVTFASDSSRHLDAAALGALFDKWVEGTNADTDIGKFGFDMIAEQVMGKEAFAGPEGAIARMMVNKLGEALTESGGN